jgi:hypothetical protein
VNLLERERETSYAAKTTNKIETTRGVYAISIPFSYHKKRKKGALPSHTVHVSFTQQQTPTNEYNVNVNVNVNRTYLIYTRIKNSK